MIKVFAAIIMLVGLGFAYETYSGADYGVKRTLGKSWEFAGGIFAGGYGMATGVATGVGGSVQGLSKNAGGIMTGAAGSLGN